MCFFFFANYDCLCVLETHYVVGTTATGLLSTLARVSISVCGKLFNTVAFQRCKEQPSKYRRLYMCAHV